MYDEKKIECVFRELFSSGLKRYEEEASSLAPNTSLLHMEYGGLVALRAAVGSIGLSQLRDEFNVAVDALSGEGED